MFHVRIMTNDKIILNLNALYNFAEKITLLFPIPASRNQIKIDLDNEQSICLTH